MDTSDSVNYFAGIGWSLSKAANEGPSWLIHPVGSNTPPRAFASLAEVWTWWSIAIGNTLLWEAVAYHAFDVYRSDPDKATYIRSWVFDDIEISEELMMEACAPIFGDPELPNWEAHAHRLAGSCWPTNNSIFIPLLHEMILKHERHTLASATSLAKRLSSDRQRL